MKGKLFQKLLTTIKSGSIVYLSLHPSRQFEVLNVKYTAALSIRLYKTRTLEILEAKDGRCVCFPMYNTFEALHLLR